MAFKYTDDGKVHVNQALSVQLRIKAQNLLDLVGLQRYEDSLTASDRRWKNRKDAFEKAKLALELYSEALNKGAGDAFADALGLWASDNGFFSIWLQTFDKYPSVRKKIIGSFRGTALDAFNAATVSIRRTDEL